jgi:Uma2 family endonuclease
MSPVTKFSDLDLNKVYTYADYLTWQFDERVELIKGFIRKMSPAPSRKHQVVSSNLHGHFFATFKNHSCNLFHAPFDVRLPVATKKKNSTVVQPDICIIRDKNKLDDKGCNGSPDLIVEIISVNNSKHDVEEAGVKEYWIVFPEEKFVNLYYLENNKFIGMKPFTEGETLQSKAFENLKINVVDVFENID